MTAPAKNHRPWFQFGTVTVLGIVTAVALASAWYVNRLHWIQERRDCDTFTLDGHPISFALVGSETGRAPGLLWLFGERGYDRMRIVFPGFPDEKHLSEEQRAALKRVRWLYREAEVSVNPPFSDLKL